MALGATIYLKSPCFIRWGTFQNRKEPTHFFEEANLIEIVEHEDKRMFKDFCQLLNAGEASSIILAMQKKLPLIINEKKGRAFAKRMNMNEYKGDWLNRYYQVSLLGRKN